MGRTGRSCGPVVLILLTPVNVTTSILRMRRNHDCEQLPIHLPRELRGSQSSSLESSAEPFGTEESTCHSGVWCISVCAVCCVLSMEGGRVFLKLVLSIGLQSRVAAL